MRRTILFILLLTALGAKAQVDPEILTQRFHHYTATWPKVKLSLLFNQDKFAPGDTAWFKAWFLTDELENIRGKQLINLQLSNHLGEIKAHFLFGLTDGTGQNQIPLPLDLEPGIYLVTAYSNWMKNFDPVLVCRKEIVVVKKNKVVQKPSPTFAKTEGGHLVADVANHLVVLAPAKKPVILSDENGKEIAQAVANENGLATLVLTPSLSSRWFIKTLGDTAILRLPHPAKDGCSLFLENKNDGTIQLELLLPASSKFRLQALTVAITSRGKMKQIRSVRPGTADKSTLTFSSATLDEGLHQMSVLDEQGELVASRTFYHDNLHPARPQIKLLRTNYSVREHVALEVEVTDDQGRPLAGEFAFSAVNAALLDSTRHNSLSDELQIVASLRNRFLIDRTQPDWRKALDLRLILEEQPLPWNEIVLREIPKPKYAYQSVIQRSGLVFNGDSRLPVPDNTQIMLYLQNSKAHYHTFTTEGNKLGLAIFDVFGEDEFFYLGEIGRESIPNMKIVWNEEHFGIPYAPPAEETSTPDPYAAYASKRKLMERSYGYFGKPPAPLAAEEVVKGPDFEKLVGRADINIKVQDYIIFQTMEELIKEVIPSVFYRQNDKKPILRVAVMEPLRSLADPVYIIDGIATRNTEFFMSLKPANLITIKVIVDAGKLEPFSLLGKNGIILVKTKAGNWREGLDDKGKLIEGLNPARPFTTPDYVQKHDLHRPDFRSTIYWNPSVKTNENGKATIDFFTSDDLGPIRLRLEGMTTHGKSFLTTEQITVDLR